HKFLQQLPTALPDTQEVPEIFLTPQSSGPIQGRSWGLRLHYNCTIVRDRTEFTILDRYIRNDNKTGFYEYLNAHLANSQPTNFARSMQAQIRSDQQGD